LSATASAPDVAPLPRAAAHRHWRPVHYWALAGVVMMALAAWTIGSWLADGPHHVAPAHPVDVPTYMKVGIRFYEIAGCIAVPLVTWFWLIRPWRRAGEITASGLAVVGFATMYWQDPLVNYFNTAFVLNSYAVNLNSWGSYFPFWRGANPDHLIVTPVFNLLYLWVAFLTALLVSKGMGRARARWPHWSNWRLFVMTVITCFFIDIVVETGWLRLGINSYPGAWPGFSLYHGHYYQLPLMEALLTAPTFWGGMAALLFFRDDRGRTIPERGIDDLALGRRARSWLRVLAFVGAVQVIYFGYNGTFAITQGLYASPWPKDVIDRPYFVNDHCGPGTRFDCPPYRSLNPWLIRPVLKNHEAVAPAP
jgi:hypothetical protein